MNTSLVTDAKRGSTFIVELLLNGEDPACKQLVTGTTALMEAALNNSFDVARCLLHGGVDANDKDSLKQTALHFAAMKGHTECIHLLKAHGARTNVASKYHHTPLTYALESGFIELADILCPDGVNAVNMDNGRTLLHHACLSGSIPCVQYLVAKGANPNIQDSSKAIPIMYAVDNRLKKIAEILSPVSDPSIMDHLGRTTLMRVMVEPHTNEEMWNILQRSGYDVSCSGRRDITPLIHFIFYLHVYGFRKIDWLFEVGVNPNVVCCGKTALWEAAQNSRSYTMVKKLLEYNADVSLTNLVCFGRTPLQQAVCNGHPDTVKLLLSAGCSLNNIAPLAEPPPGSTLQLWAFILDKAAKPRTLREFCKLSIKRSIGYGLGAESAIKTLPLPLLMKLYLSAAYCDPAVRDLDLNIPNNICNCPLNVY